MKRHMAMWIVLAVCGAAQGGYYGTAFDTADAVDDWTVVSGNWSLDPDAGTYTATTSSSGILSVYTGEVSYAGDPADLRDYTINADLVVNGGDAAVVARYQSPTQFYQFRLHSQNGLQIYRFNNGATLLVTAAVDNVAEITGDYTLSFSVSGSQLTGRLYVDGELVQTATAVDDTFPVGGFGLRVYAGDSVYSGVRATGASAAISIFPTDEAIGVPVDPTFEWITSEDPWGDPIEGVAQHNFYISSGNADDPNVFLVAEIPADGAAASYSDLPLEKDRTYHWQIEEALSDGEGGVYTPGDPNNLWSPLWTFQTVQSLPQFTPEGQPQDAFVDAGETAQFAVEVLSSSELTYQWYRSDDAASDTFGDDELLAGEVASTLTIESVGSEQEGYYYVVATNDVGSTASAPAVLVLKQLLAHWTLDASDYAEGAYQDIAGDHDAVTGGSLITFVEGVDGTADGAILVDPNSWAMADAWDPTEQTGQMTISFWTQWGGPTSGPQRPIAKREVEWASMRWTVLVEPGTSQVEFESYADGTGPIGNFEQTDEWQLVTVAWEDGNATLYINGLPTGTASVTLGEDGVAPIILGAGNMEGNYLYNGILDDMRIYNYAFSAEEVVDQLWYPMTEESVCLYPAAAQFDLVPDCKVDLQDFAVFAEQWLYCGFYPVCP